MPQRPTRQHAAQRTRTGRRYRAITHALLAGAALTLALLPFDAAISSRLAPLGASLGGDLRRELETLQQFGDLGTTLIIAAVIWLADPPRRRRLLDWLAGIAIAATALTLTKMLLGRPRPRLDDPFAFLGPFAAYPLPDATPPGVYHAWQVWAPISSDLWSMPSSHTGHAACAAAFLAVLYPRLRPLLIALVATVGLCRVLFNAHYPADVAAGATIGFAAGYAAARGYLGVRALDWLWARAINRARTPALPACVRHEHRAARPTPPPRFPPAPPSAPPDTAPDRG